MGEDEEEVRIIRIPKFDFSDLIEKYKNSLVGRMFHVEGRSIEALLTFMPGSRIWDVEGRVRGTDLGNGKFQFDFKEEEDLLKVLQRRPCHFNRWSFSLERWEANIREDFPNTMLFWVHVKGIPTIYKKDETFRGIGDALGETKAVDADGARVQVSLNGDNPLHFESKVGFDNGDIVNVTLRYEGLYRYCFTCKRISHEERSCPELSELEKMRKKSMRADAPSLEVIDRSLQNGDKRRTERAESSSRTRRNLEMDYEQRLPTRFSYHRDDLRREIQEKRDYRSKGVWNRLDQHRKTDIPRYRERYHPYGGSRRDNLNQRPEDSYTSSSKYQKRKDDRDVFSQGTNQRGSRFVEKESVGASDSQRTISDIQQTEYHMSRLRLDHQPRAKHDYRSRGYEQHGSYREKAGPSKEVRWKEKVTPGPLAKESVREDLPAPPPPPPLPQDRNSNQLHRNSNGEHLGRNTEPESVSKTVPSQRRESTLDVSATPIDQDTNQVVAARMELEKELGIPPLEAEMDAAMVDNDDLLGDEGLIEEGNIEDEGLAEEGFEQIEAISQLSLSEEFMGKKKELPKVKSSSKNVINSEASAAVVVEAGPLKEVRPGKKKAPRSPDIKGIASKKINALRIRSSPKKKAIPVRRKFSSAVPRNEVFPSAISKKSAAKSGSVVSQKPPSTHI